MSLFDKLKSISDSFFDGLKANAIKSAVNKSAKMKKRPPVAVVQKMIDLEKASKELDDILKEMDSD